MTETVKFKLETYRSPLLYLQHSGVKLDIISENTLLSGLTVSPKVIYIHYPYVTQKTIKGLGQIISLRVPKYIYLPIYERSKLKPPKLAVSGVDIYFKFLG